MTNPIHSFGIVGLGKMGAGLAANALEKGFEIAGVDTRSIPDDLQRGGLKAAADLKALAALLPRPRFIMQPSRRFSGRFQPCPARISSRRPRPSRAPPPVREPKMPGC